MNYTQKTMSKIDEIRTFIKEEALKFGANNEKDYVERNNTGNDALSQGGAYFGFISPDEDNSGPYHDFSLTILPDKDDKPWLVCLGIGSLGFKNDYELASFPGVRRLFFSLISSKGYCKTSFIDIENGLPRSFLAKLPHLKNTLKTYSKVLPACEIVEDPTSVEGKKIISAFVAGYAELRKWPSNNEHRKAKTTAISAVKKEESPDDEKDVLNLILSRKYVVLEGAPGTGKTMLGKKIGEKLNAEIFFTQFHAETNYSDFIYGIKPNLNQSNLNYQEQKGIFLQALQFAISNPFKNVLLIIDELNRANLSNILGPIFYLFEYQMDDNSVNIEICNGFSVKKIPKNFYVIGTMNTADRSLAVVDFALRRRFAWYTLKPRILETKAFFKDDFLTFQEIFYWYASSEELNLQPGHAYFIANSKEEMTQRIRYELFPLIREYLLEGIMLKAKEDFNEYFSDRIKDTLFK